MRFWHVNSTYREKEGVEGRGHDTEKGKEPDISLRSKPGGPGGQHVCLLGPRYDEGLTTAGGNRHYTRHIGFLHHHACMNHYDHTYVMNDGCALTDRDDEMAPLDMRAVMSSFSLPSSLHTAHAGRSGDGYDSRRHCRGKLPRYSHTHTHTQASLLSSVLACVDVQIQTTPCRTE